MLRGCMAILTPSLQARLSESRMQMPSQPRIPVQQRCSVMWEPIPLFPHLNAAGIRHGESQRRGIDGEYAVDGSDSIVAELKRWINKCGNNGIGSHITEHRCRTGIRGCDGICILDSDNRACKDGVRIAIQ